MLHLNSQPNPQRDEPGHDPWNKVRPYIDELNNNFRSHFVPNQNVCNDESLIGMKNRVAYIYSTCQTKDTAALD